MKGFWVLVAMLALGTLADAASRASTGAAGQPDGTEYRRACTACHGGDGRGVSATISGMVTELPDFTDCSFVTREPDGDWQAIVAQGGPVRRFHRHMPAFGSALSEAEIQQALDYIRSFCKEEGWPRGDLNLPRPLLTEKAYPEDEFVYSVAVSTSSRVSVKNKLVYEQRLGSRSQFELIVPFTVLETDNRGTRLGPGDIAFGGKTTLFSSLATGTIVSLAGEIILPTGNAELGFGKGHYVFEPFLALGQLIAGIGFFQVQVGAEIPDDQSKGNNELFWRVVAGASLAQQNLERTWSPMVEVVGVHEFADEPETLWSIAPALQVTLSPRGHVMLALGVEIPLNETGSRKPAVLAYLLWDWFDGGFFEGW